MRSKMLGLFRPHIIMCGLKSSLFSIFSKFTIFFLPLQCSLSSILLSFWNLVVVFVAHSWSSSSPKLLLSPIKTQSPPEITVPFLLRLACESQWPCREMPLPVSRNPIFLLWLRYLAYLKKSRSSSASLAFTSSVILKVSHWCHSWALVSLQQQQVVGFNEKNPKAPEIPVAHSSVNLLWILVLVSDSSARLQKSQVSFVNQVLSLFMFPLRWNKWIYITSPDT